MAPEPTSSEPVDGQGPADTGGGGWPDRKAKSGDEWGRLHFVPQPGHPDRLHIFAQPVKMEKAEENRILSNWKKATQGHGRCLGMAHDLRPSTPRDIRAGNRIQKLKDEGVKVDHHMENHMRNVIERNCGLHDALRHYTQDESNVLMPYLNEFANREDRMLLEWAQQKKHNYDLWQEASSLKASRNGQSERGASQKDSSRNGESTKDPSTIDYERGVMEDDSDEEDPTLWGPKPPSNGESSTNMQSNKKKRKAPSQGELSPASKGKSTTKHDHGVLENGSDEEDPTLWGPKPPSNGESSTNMQPNKNKGKAPSQGESSSTSKGKKSQSQAQTRANSDRSSLEQGKIEIIMNLDSQLSTLERRLEGLGANSSRPSSSTRASSASSQDAFDRIIELLRGVIEERQRTLNSLNKARSRVIRGVEANGTPPPEPPAQLERQATAQQEPSDPPSSGFLGTLRKAWNKCIEPSVSTDSSRSDSRSNSRGNSIQIGLANPPQKTQTVDVPPPLSPFAPDPGQNNQGMTDSQT